MRFIPAALALLVAVLYFVTMCPTIFPGDSGELAAAVTRLEIAHPPGYPLLGLIGTVWVKALAFLRPIVALNVLSLLFAVAAVAVLQRLLWVRLKPQSLAEEILIAAGSALFAVSLSLWSAAAQFEVYSLSALLIVLSLLFLLRFVDLGATRDLLLAAACLCAGFAHHFMIAALLPAFLIILFANRRRLNVQIITVCIGLVILGASLYFVIMIRAGQNPLLSWMYPDSLSGLIDHIFARNYKAYIAEPRLGDIPAYLMQSFKIIRSELLIPILVLAIPGAIMQWRKSKVVAMALLSVVASNLIINFFYLIPDIRPYFLPILIVMLIWTAECLASAVHARQKAVWAVAMAAWVLVVACGYANFEKCDLSDRTIAEDYAKVVLDQVPEKATLFAGTDYAGSPLLYFRYVEAVGTSVELYSALPTSGTFRRRFNAAPKLNGLPYNRQVESVLRSDIAMRAALVREPIQVVNDVGRSIESFTSNGFLYLPVTSARINAVPELKMPIPEEVFDLKEAGTCINYCLIRAEEAERSGEEDPHEWYKNAFEFARFQRGFALSNELAGYFTATGNTLWARRTLESGLEIGSLRAEQKERLLTGLLSVMIESGDLARADSLIAQIDAIDPANQSVGYNRLLMVAIRAENFGDAVMALDAYRKMHGMYPDQLEISFRIGRLSLRTGDFAEATARFDECRRHNYKLQEINTLAREHGLEIVR